MATQDFLKQRAVAVAIGGRYSLANWYDPQGNRREFACRTTRINPFRMMVSVPVVGKVGDRVTSYFGDFGKLDGFISDAVAGSFLLELAVTRARREKLASKLAWLEAKQNDPSIKDVRGEARIIPANPHSSLVFADGATLGCFVIDMSVSGVAVSADVQPEIGTPLAVGACVGRVVRHFREGFAVKFVEPQLRGALEKLIARPAPPLPGQGAKPMQPLVRRTPVAASMPNEAVCAPDADVFYI